MNAIIVRILVIIQMEHVNPCNVAISTTPTHVQLRIDVIGAPQIRFAERCVFNY